MIRLLEELVDDNGQEVEIRHVGRDILAWSLDSAAMLERIAQDREVELTTGPVTVGQPWGPVDPAVLQPLRTIFLIASDNSLAWELVAQVAQAERIADLLDLARKRHEYTLRQLRWANTMIKTASPQVLATL